MMRSMSKKSRGAEEKSRGAVAKAISGNKANFARVSKVLGGKKFHVSFFDGEELHTGIVATPRGLFSAGGKVRVKISEGDFVLLEGAEVIKTAKGEATVEIYGILDKPTADQLYSTGLIHKSIYKTDEDSLDDLFVEAVPDNEELDLNAL